MPGLLRAVGRTAVVAGTATATANAVNRRQASKNVAAYQEAEAEVAPPPQQVVDAPAPEPTQDDTIAQLERLANLKAQGVLTDEEFAQEKAKILG